jgi:hypothetical protein
MRFFRTKLLILEVALGALFLAPPAAHAQKGVDLETKSAARKLAAEGQKLFDTGDYAAALEKFNLADSLNPAPTLGLRAARCLVKLGRVVEASERYLEVTRVQLDRTANATLRKAQAEAVVEREKLLPTIPTLKIEIAGPVGSGIIVTIDEKPVPEALIGQKRPTDPGAHRVEIKRADTAVNGQVVLKPGESGRLLLQLPPLPRPKPLPSKSEGFPFRTVGFIGIGVGVGGAVLGAVSGGLAVSNEQSLLKRCGTDRICPPDARAQSNGYDAARALTTIGIVMGGVGLGAGIPLLLVGSKKSSPAGEARLLPWITFGGVGVRGIF